MKKTFRTILAGALALLTVSCYDDSALREDIKELDERVTAIENTLNAEVGGINDLATRLAAAEKAIADNAADVTEILTRLDAVDGAADGKIKNLEDAIADLKAADKNLNDELVAAIAKIAVVNVAEADGKVVLTLADNKTIELSKPLANVDNANLVTIVEEEGKKYWAVMQADGTAQKLDVEVGGVDLKFRVSNNSLEYSVNGGAWTRTGAYVANSSYYLLTDFYQGGEMDMDTWEYVADDFYTLVFGGEEFKLPLYKVDNSVVTIKAGKTYFKYEQSFSVGVTIKDVTSVYLMSKPDGWKAKLADNVLTVTAPSEAAVESGSADADGEVLLHCTTVEGKCKIARLSVATTPGFSLTVVEDSVFIVNPDVVTSVNPMMDWETTDFNDAYIGLAPVAAFEADPVAYVAECQNNYDDIIFMLSGWKQNTMDWETGEFLIGGAYEEGVYEVDVINTTVADIYEYTTYSEIPDGSRFVVWACPVDDKGAPVTDKLVFGYYSSPVVAKIEAVDGGVSVSDIEVAVTVSGAESYYVGVMLEKYMYGYPIDDYMQNEEGPFGRFQMALGWNPEYAFENMGTLFGGENGMVMPETIKVSELMGGALTPNSKVYVWVFPVVEGLALEDYTYAENLKPYIYDFTTSNIQAGGTASVEFVDENFEYTSLYVGIEATEGSIMVYYNWYSSDEFNALEDAAADLIESGYPSVDFPVDARNSNVKPGDMLILAAMAVGADGKYGQVMTKNCPAPEIQFSDTFKAVSATPSFEVSGSNWMVTMNVAVEGGTAAKYYYYFNNTPRTDEQLNELPLGSTAYWYYNSATTIPALYYYAADPETKQFAVVVESTTGELSKPLIITVNKPTK